MIRLPNTDNIRNVLCLGAHSDDIELGCGGTILRLAAERPDMRVRWVVFSGNAAREREARHSAAMFLERVKSKEVVTQTFRDGFFPFHGERIKESFEQIKSEFVPDLVFTHCRDDAHQDHNLLARLTWNTFRDHLILEYEIPKYDGDLGHPNFFVALDEATVRRKSEILMQAFPSQAGRQWFSDDTFRAILRLRGIECNAPGRFAEAFHCRKMVL